MVKSSEAVPLESISSVMATAKVHIYVTVMLLVIKYTIVDLHPWEPLVPRCCLVETDFDRSEGLRTKPT